MLPDSRLVTWLSASISQWYPGVLDLPPVLRDGPLRVPLPQFFGACTIARITLSGRPAPFSSASSGEFVGNYRA